MIFGDRVLPPQAGRVLAWAGGLARSILPGVGVVLSAMAMAAPPSPLPTALPSFLPLTFESLESLGPDSQSILALAQDSQGFIWIGTVEGGLYRYDGRSVVRYTNDPANAASLPGGRVAALYCDQQGRLWIGTDEGLARFDPATNGFRRYEAPDSTGSARIVRRIISDGEQGMWLASWGGLQHFDPATGRFQVYHSNELQPDALASNDINAVARDPQGGVWAATWPAGVDYRAPGKSGFLHMRLDDAARPDPRLNDVRAMLYEAGDLWLGTDAGVVVWRAGTPWSERKRLPGPEGRVNSIDRDHNGRIWIGTRTEGLMRWDAAGQRFQPYLHHAEDTHSLPSNAISASLEDRGGTLWVASFTDGVSRANMGNYGFERILPREVAPDSFPSNNFVRSVGAAPQGRLWLGVDDGLALFDPFTHRLLKKYTAQNGQPGSLSHNSISALYQQPDGPLWIGTTKGLNRYDPRSERFSLVPYETPAEGFINTVAPGRRGTLWIGTAGSLQHYDPTSGDMRKYRHNPIDPSSRSEDDTSTVLEDSQGRVWVGDVFRGGGLDLLDQQTGKFRHFRHDPAQEDSLASDKVTCLYEDLYGTIWIGTARGLNRLVPDRDGQPRFHGYLGAGELGPVMIESIQSDRTGILWIATAKGLSRLDPSSGQFMHYTADDGLTEGLYQGSSTRSTDSKLYYGSSAGLTAVYPALPFRAPSPPQVAITDIRIFDKSLNLGLPANVRLEGSVTAPRSLTMPWNASVLSLEFAALHYAAPRRNRYAYKLEGFDSEWVAADASHPMATYTNLYPGSYRFLVQATSNKGLHSPVIELAITVTPPLWQTWWFRIAAALAVMLAAFILYRARVRGLKRRARRLEMLVRQRTHQLEVSNRKLHAMASTDGLTNLANRRHFDIVLAREWARSKRMREPLALAMIDVDYFKPYNDHYGHQQGDDCLRQVAAVLAAAMQRGTDLAARYGGEEFAFIAPDTGIDGALAVAERLRAGVEALALTHEKSPLGRVTISLGVATIVPDEEHDSDLLLRSADQALYRAKTQGRNLAILGYSAVPRGLAATPAQ